MEVNTCKVPKCLKKGHLEKNGKRIFVLGYCSTHYERRRSGKPLNKRTVHDYRPAIIEGDIARIPLGLDAKDGYAVVDAEFAGLDKYKWYANGLGYAIRNLNVGCRFIHHEIVGKPPVGLVVDHINRNVRDNRASNLRIVSQRVNSRNSKLNSKGKTPYHGVSWSKLDKKWSSRLTLNDRNIYLGLYDNLEEAISARLCGESIYWGDEV